MNLFPSCLLSQMRGLVISCQWSDKCVGVYGQEEGPGARDVCVVVMWWSAESRRCQEMPGEAGVGTRAQHQNTDTFTGLPPRHKDWHKTYKQIVMIVALITIITQPTQVNTVFYWQQWVWSETGLYGWWSPGTFFPHRPLGNHEDPQVPREIQASLIRIWI